jgi:hypothetical protein
MNLIRIKKILQAQSESTANLEKVTVQEFITDIAKSK